MPVPPLRLSAANDAPVRAGGDFVLYWMIASRRLRWSFALDRAVELATDLGKPLVVLEALRTGYPWASDRLHRFILDGMAANLREAEGKTLLYYPYVERAEGEGSGLLEALAARASAVVTDEFPGFFLPRMVAAAAARLPVRVEQADASGLLPLRASDRAFPTAYAFRRHFQKVFREHLALPKANPFARVSLAPPKALPKAILKRWPPATLSELEDAALPAALPIDHGVAPVAYRGGAAEGAGVLKAFVARRLARYGEERNQPEADAASGLSPYLHFGHVSVHEAFRAVTAAEGWTPLRLAEAASGKREGWWGLGASAEGFLDELLIWRELGYGFCFHRPADYDRYESLPDWARASLERHAADARPHRYTPEELERAETHDPLWNAAQRQLLREGRIHNYLRMLWGKKILEWSGSPREALATLIHLNNRHAVDGRDPNSYTGIFWTLGRFDRPWGPERPIFGVVRYMSSESAARKLSVKGYLARYGA